VRLTVGGGRDRSDYLENKPVGTFGGADLFGYSDPFPNDATDTSGFGFVPRYYGERATYGAEFSIRF